MACVARGRGETPVTRSSKLTWKDLIQDVIAKLPHQFTLSEVLVFQDRLAKEYPQNRNIDAKIRQTLQILRDQGTLQFLGAGMYRRLDVPPKISLHFDPSLAAAYTSRSQMARVMMETWAELNLYCLNCPCDRLGKLPANTPVADFNCPKCSSEYQLKAKNGRFEGRVEGAEYKHMLDAIRSGTLPEYFLAEYDTRWSILVWVRAIPGRKIDEDRVVARKPLSPTAKRAGWIGCNINIADLPHVDVIAPMADERARVRSEWRAL
jgi:hypothetical protein